MLNYFIFHYLDTYEIDLSCNEIARVNENVTYSIQVNSDSDVRVLLEFRGTNYLKKTAQTKIIHDVSGMFELMETSFTHTFDKPGNYEAKLNVDNQYSMTQNVSIIEGMYNPIF
jgi:PKD repeat protein